MMHQGFRVLSEAERTAALYSLLQHSTQVQIRFFITVLQQMARSDPMTALLSPGMGGSMQAQMEAKLLSMGLKSPGFPPPSPSARNFNGAPSQNTNNNFLTPDSALNNNSSPAASGDAAATLAQQRARLKASNADAASRRISAPGTLSNTGDGRNVWQPPQLGQVAERDPSPVAEQAPPSPGPTTNSTARPKSTDFTGVANSFKARTSTESSSDAAGAGVGQDVLSPMTSGNWASMVNTPLVPMFAENKPNLDNAASKLATWKSTGAGASGQASGRINLADAKTFRRTSKSSTPAQSSDANGGNIYGDDGNLLAPGSGASKSPNTKSPNTNQGFNQMWPGMQRSPGLSSASSNRFNPEEQLAAGMPFGLPGMGMGSPNMPMGMSPLMSGLGGFNMMNLGMGMNGIDPIQAQYLAAQIAAGQFAGFPGMQNPMMGRGTRGPASARGGSGMGSNKSQSGRGGDGKPEDDINPDLLNDIPAWLRSLRLHKYTPNFEGVTWREMVVMDEKTLEDRGVAALGARRKMLKTFEAVRTKMGISLPGEEA